MTSHIVFYFLVIVANYVIGKPTSSRYQHDVTKDIDVQGYLERYGYLKKINENRQKDGNRPAALLNYQHSIEKLQEFMGLPRTGILDEATLKLMSMSRCGNQDIDEDDDHTGGRSKRFTRVGQYWKKNEITYTIKNTTPKVGERKTIEAIERAFGIWGKHTPLKFRSVPIHERPDMMIMFARGNHGDNTAFDGRGGFLAHAFYPGKEIGGDTHFDFEEPWVYEAANPNSGNDLFLVAVHELGHALGLAHSQDPTAIMAPVYKYHNLSGFDISQDDINGIQAIYGRRSITSEKDEKPEVIPPKRTTTTKPPPPKTPKFRPTKKTTTTKRWRPTSTTPTTTTKSKPIPTLCSLDKYDAITYIRGDLYIFSGKWLWRKRKNDDVWQGPHPITSYWREVDHVTAVYEDLKQDRIRFFQGYIFYEYEATLLRRSRVHVREVGLQNDGVEAAIWWRDNDKAYFFRNNWFWKLEGKDNKKIKTIDGYPKKRYVEFGGVPSFDTAFTGQGKDSKFTYFVIGDRYLKFDNTKGHVTTSEFQSFKDDFIVSCSKVKIPPPSSPDGASDHLPAIIAVATVASLFLVAIIIYVTWQQRHQQHNTRHHRVMVVDKKPLQHSGGSGKMTSQYKRRHQDDYVTSDDAEKLMCVTIAQQRWRLMRFNFQGQL